MVKLKSYICMANGLVISGTPFLLKKSHERTWRSPDGILQNQIDHDVWDHQQGMEECTTGYHGEVQCTRKNRSALHCGQDQDEAVESEEAELNKTVLHKLHIQL